MAAIIEIQRMSKRFGEKTAVSRLSLTVPEGSIFAFLGPNGAGKTTTIKTMMNIMEPTEGRISIIRDPRRSGSSRPRTSDVHRRGRN